MQMIAPGRKTQQGTDLILGLRVGHPDDWPQRPRLLGIEYHRFGDEYKIVMGYWFGEWTRAKSRALGCKGGV